MIFFFRYTFNEAFRRIQLLLKYNLEIILKLFADVIIYF